MFNVDIIMRPLISAGRCRLVVATSGTNGVVAWHEKRGDQLQGASRVKEQRRLADVFIQEQVSRGSSVKGQIFPIPANEPPALVLLYDSCTLEDLLAFPCF